MKKEYVMCRECGMVESLEHVMTGRHECGIITDFNYRIIKPIKLKIGKHRRVKFGIKSWWKVLLSKILP